MHKHVTTIPRCIQSTTSHRSLQVRDTIYYTNFNYLTIYSLHFSHLLSKDDTMTQRQTNGSTNRRDTNESFTDILHQDETVNHDHHAS